MKLSIHMLILNGASVVERALRHLAKLDAEVVVVDTGSTDGTPEAIQHLCGSVFPSDYGQEARLRCRIAARISPESHPDMFFIDSASSWEAEMPGPFTGRTILRDWAKARNMGLDACQGEYIMKLDADDEIVEGAANIPSALKFLDEHPIIDFLMCPYEVMEPFTPNPLHGFPVRDHIETITMYDRIWRNEPFIRFELPIHEHLVGKGTSQNLPNWYMVAQGLRFRDWRDSPGDGVRLAYRNYKVFMLEYEKLAAAKLEMSLGFLLSTIGEIVEVNPKFALSLLNLASSRDPGKKYDFDYQLNLGRACGRIGLDQMALEAFQAAARLTPNSASSHLELGFQLQLMRSSGWKGELSKGIEIAESMSGFNVDHRLLRKAIAELEKEDGTSKRV